jgi:hypothetical protein
MWMEAKGHCKRRVASCMTSFVWYFGAFSAFVMAVFIRIAVSEDAVVGACTSRAILTFPHRNVGLSRCYELFAFLGIFLFVFILCVIYGSLNRNTMVVGTCISGFILFKNAVRGMVFQSTGAACGLALGVRTEDATVPNMACAKEPGTAEEACPGKKLRDFYLLAAEEAAFRVFIIFIRQAVWSMFDKLDKVALGVG